MHSVLASGLICALAVIAAAHEVHATPRIEDVRYTSGDLTLGALLLLPESPSAVPAVVIVQGSGASDRSNRWSRDIADALVDLGVAVLLTDKRGTGASQGDWRSADFRALAGDALAGVKVLRERPEIAADRVGVVGLSQGGQVVPIAAAQSDEVAFVISLSSKAVGFAEGSFVEMTQTARRAGLAEPDVQVVRSVNRAAVRYLAFGDWAQYEAARSMGMETAARGVVAGFPAKSADPIWGFLRAVYDYDPLVYWAQLRQPALIVYGKDDERDNVPVHESVRRLEHMFSNVGTRDVDIRVIPGVGHSLRDPQSHRLSDALRGVLDTWMANYVR